MGIIPLQMSGIYSFCTLFFISEKMSLFLNWFSIDRKKKRYPKKSSYNFKKIILAQLEKCNNVISLCSSSFENVIITKYLEYFSSDTVIHSKKTPGIFSYLN